MISKNKHKNHKGHKYHLSTGPRIRAPKDFKFKVVEEKTYQGGFYGYTVKLFHREMMDTRIEVKGKYKIVKKIGDKYIGAVRLAKHYTKPNVLNTHSSLNDKFHHQGLGALMYAKAIQVGLDKGFRVHSSGGSSDMAQRVWRGHLIRRYFRINVRTNRPGAVSDKWYAYPKRVAA